MKSYKTVREAAEAMLMEESYVDIYGRKVGLPYTVILKKLHELFPRGSTAVARRTSLRSLRMTAYALNNSARKMPVRRRSARVLARDYARTLLLVINPKTSRGWSYIEITRRVLKKFPGQRIAPRQLKFIEHYLPKKFQLPPRPEAQ